MTDGLPQPQRLLALIVTLCGVTMAVLDGALANIALPTIAHEFGVEPADTIWIVNAYQLTNVMLMLPIAALGDIIGYRRIYLAGLAFFTLASVACAMSDSLLTLTLARIAQGIGAAGVMSVNLALVRLIVPADRLGATLGWNTLIIAGSSSFGPAIGAAIISFASWPWLFAANMPLGLTALFLGLKVLPESSRANRRFDWFSAALNAGTFGLIISGISAIGHGAATHWVALQLGLGLVIAVLFVRRQLTLTTPLLPLDLLRNRLFALSVATSACSFVAQMLAYVSLPFRFQHDLGFSVAETGLMVTAWTAGVAVMAPLSGRLADRFPAGILGGIGLAGMMLGCLALAFLQPGASTLDALWRMLLCGLGFGMFQTPNNRTMMNTPPRERAGAASGMLGTARLTGQTSGAALAALLMSLSTSGTQTALLTAAAFAAVAAAVSLARLTPSGR